MVIAARICLYWDTDWVVGRVNFGVYWVQKHYKRLIVIASIQRGSEETTLRERESNCLVTSALLDSLLLLAGLQLIDWCIQVCGCDSYLQYIGSNIFFFSFRLLSMKMFWRTGPL